MPAAALIFEQRRMNVEKIEQPKAVNEDITCMYPQIVPEKDIKIGSTSSEEQGLAIRICLNIPGKPPPLFYLKIF